MYFTLNQYLKEKYGEKVWKVPVDAGFSCPNKTGEKGNGGCIYCNTVSFTHVEAGDISEQVTKRIRKLQSRNINKYIVYFQSGTNTYGDIETIKNKVDSSLVSDCIVGIHIGTRPDYVDEDVLSYFSELNKTYEVSFELGLQTCNNLTLDFINRGHTAEEFAETCKRIKAKGIKVCAHVILGLPGETQVDMIETANFLAKLKVDSVKFHHLQILKGTKLAELYKQGKIKLLCEKEYIELLSKCIARLSPYVVISRLIGDAPSELLIAPQWPHSKVEFITKLNTFMKQNNFFQGKLYLG